MVTIKNFDNWMKQQDSLLAGGGGAPFSEVLPFEESVQFELPRGNDTSFMDNEVFGSGDSGRQSVSSLDPEALAI